MQFFASMIAALVLFVAGGWAMFAAVTISYASVGFTGSIGRNWLAVFLLTAVGALLLIAAWIMFPLTITVSQH